jgi:hypothetical protein
MAGSVHMFVIGSPFSDGRVHNGGWERLSHRDVLPMSISQQVDTRKKNQCTSQL